MITADMYKKYLTSQGNNLGEKRMNQSDKIMNATFTGDVTYKKVYILTKNGWKYEDAKYQRHSTPSILKDAVDYYLQFRPKVHYPVGTYVFIPDDTSPQINLNESEIDNPFALPDERISQLWMIVGRNNANSFVRYSVLECNWNFKWIWNGEVYKCWGAVRNANSYTSGKWSDEYTSSLDNLVSAWLPDTYYTYGDSLSDFNLSDTRTILYEQRFMLTNNTIDPKVYQTTKVTDLTPKGLVKLSLKQDEFDLHRDNLELEVCDYYTVTGELQVDTAEEDLSDNTAVIHSMYINSDGELDVANTLNLTLNKGVTSYYNVAFSNENIAADWKVNFLYTDDLSADDISYYEGLMKLDVIDTNIVSIRPAKAQSLVGKKFNVVAADSSGVYYASIELEVVE